MLLTAPGKTSQTPTVPHIHRPGRAGSRFDSQGNLGGGEKCVLANGHEHGSRIAAFALDQNFETGRRGDCCDDAKRNSALLEETRSAAAIIDV